MEEDENKDKSTDDIQSWDSEFLNVDRDTLFELILAANFLNIKGLLNVTCKSLADMIKGKTPVEARQMLINKDDSTTEEEDEVDRMELAD